MRWRRIIRRCRHRRLRNVAERRLGGGVVERRARRRQPVAADARRQPVDRDVVGARRRRRRRGSGVLHPQHLDVILDLGQLQKVVL